MTNGTASDRPEGKKAAYCEAEHGQTDDVGKPWDGGN